MNEQPGKPTPIHRGDPVTRRQSVLLFAPSQTGSSGCDPSSGCVSSSCVSRSCSSRAMETEKLEQQVASVERGMALLKREHLAMLTGLQMEISRLKRRCSELNCELDARFPAAEECELVSRRQASERLLEQQACAGANVRTALRARQVRAWALGRALRSDQRRFLEELKRRSHRITALGRELHRQTLTSAALGQQLYLQRGLLVAGGEGGEEEEEEQCSGGSRPEGPGRREVPDEIEREEEWECDEEDDKEDDEGEGSDSLRPPACPDQSDELCARHVRVREQRVRACVPCERVTSPQKPQPMPDPALFLVPLRYRLLRWRRLRRVRSDPQGLQEEWEDLGEEGEVRRRVDMGAAEGETAL